MDSKKKEAAMESLSTKGKPESFFQHKGLYEKPNNEQMQFIWNNYPQYSQSPHQILDWLIGEAKRIALEESMSQSET